MAATVTPVHQWVDGDRRTGVFDVLLDASYPTGGYAIAPSKFGFLSRVDSVIAQSTAGKPYDWVTSTGKLKAYKAFGTEEDSTTDLSAVTVRVKATGK